MDDSYLTSFILDLPPNQIFATSSLTFYFFIFIPGFNNPTLPILYQIQQTWTGYALPISMYSLG